MANQTKLLELGLGYRVAPGDLPRLKLMAGIELAFLDLCRLDQDDAEWFQAEAARTLARAKKPTLNLSPELLKATKNLQQNTGICITSADKGGRTVIMCADQYSEVCEVHLNDNTYQPIESFGTRCNKVHLTDPRTHLGVPVLNEDFVMPDVSDRLLRLQCSCLSNLLSKLLVVNQLMPSDM